jgi:hypothetical protein
MTPPDLGEAAVIGHFAEFGGLAATFNDREIWHDAGPIGWGGNFRQRSSSDKIGIATMAPVPTQNSESQRT